MKSNRALVRWLLLGGLIVGAGAVLWVVAAGLDGWPLGGGCSWPRIVPLSVLAGGAVLFVSVLWGLFGASGRKGLAAAARFRWASSQRL